MDGAQGHDVPAVPLRGERVHQPQLGCGRRGGARVLCLQLAPDPDGRFNGACPTRACSGPMPELEPVPEPEQVPEPVPIVPRARARARARFQLAHANSRRRDRLCRSRAPLWPRYATTRRCPRRSQSLCTPRSSSRRSSPCAAACTPSSSTTTTRWTPPAAARGRALPASHRQLFTHH